MKYIIFYTTLYYTIMISLSLFITKKYLKIGNLPIIIIVFMYIIAIIIFIFGILNDLNIISTNLETTNYLNELDFAVELPEIKLDTQTVNNKIKNDNIYLRFLNLFNKDSTCCSIDSTLKNIYYINKHGVINYNKVEQIKIHEKYLEITAHNKEVLTIIDSFMDILNDLEVIRNNLLKAKM